MPINGEKVHFSGSRPCVNVLGGLFAFNFQHFRSVDQWRFSMVEHGTIWGMSRPRVQLNFSKMKKFNICRLTIQYILNSK